MDTHPLVNCRFAFTISKEFQESYTVLFC